MNKSFDDVTSMMILATAGLCRSLGSDQYRGHTVAMVYSDIPDIRMRFWIISGWKLNSPQKRSKEQACESSGDVHMWYLVKENAFRGQFDIVAHYSIHTFTLLFENFRRREQPL